MRLNLSFLLALLLSHYHSQNQARLFTSDGSLFRVIVNEKPYNEKPQADVLLENVIKDTLHLKIELESGQRRGIVIYLLDKGKRTSHKEYAYKLSFDKTRTSVDFSGIYDITVLPRPLVPEKPRQDSSARYKNARLGHFCEWKDGKLFYFNNIPRAGACTEAMPNSYLQHIHLLMTRAEVPDQRYAIADHACMNNCLSTAQLTKLLAYIDYEPDKLRLVKENWPHITDPQNSKELEQSFRFESALTELYHFLKSDDAARSPAVDRAYRCAVASSDSAISEFSILLETCANDAQRLEVFKKTYKKNCYTVAQAVLLLGKFIHDREKLEAAEKLYAYCTQPEKYGEVSAVFSYATTAADLKLFVDKQKQ